MVATDLCPVNVGEVVRKVLWQVSRAGGGAYRFQEGAEDHDLEPDRNIHDLRMDPHFREEPRTKSPCSNGEIPERAPT